MTSIMRCFEIEKGTFTKRGALGYLKKSFVKQNTNTVQKQFAWKEEEKNKVTH